LSDKRLWLAAFALAIILTAALLPPHLLTEAGWLSALQRGALHSYGPILLYLGGVVAAALATGHTLTAVLKRTGAPGVRKGARFGALWLSLTGLSPLQPAADTVLSWGLLSVLLASGLRPNPALFLMPIFSVIFFGLALGAEVSLRGGRTGDDVPMGGRLRGLLSEVAPQLAGRVVLMTTLMTVITGAGRRWMEPTTPVPDGPVLDGREIFAAVAAMLVLSIVLWALGRNVRSGQPETDERTGVRVSPGAAWILVAAALLLPFVGVFISADPLHMDLEHRLAEPEGITGSWGTDEFGRDLRSRVLGAWQNAVLYGAGAAAMTFLLSVPLSVGIRRECGHCSGIVAILARVPPPILFFAGWGAVSAFNVQHTLVPVAAGVILTLLPSAARLIAGENSTAAAGASLVLSGLLLMLGWDVALGILGFIAPPSPAFGALIAGARMHAPDAPWLIQYTSAVFLTAAVLGVSALSALVSAYGLPRRHTYLRG